jgi:hypothetical protein
MAATDHNHVIVSAGMCHRTAPTRKTSGQFTPLARNSHGIDEPSLVL